MGRFIKSLVLSSTVGQHCCGITENLLCDLEPEAFLHWIHAHYWWQLVKFDTDTLPPILNALTTENNGQKLILEVAVSFNHIA